MSLPKDGEGRNLYYREIIPSMQGSIYAMNHNNKFVKHALQEWTPNSPFSGTDSTIQKIEKVWAKQAGLDTAVVDTIRPETGARGPTIGKVVISSPKKAYKVYDESIGAKERLLNQVANIRANLTGSEKRGGNIGVAEIGIKGVQKTMIASSRIDIPTHEQYKQGFVGKVEETFPSSLAISKTGDTYNRSSDSEAKILNNIAQQLGANKKVKGYVNLFTERAPCASCSNIIQKFQETYPNIQLNILDNGGKVVKPIKSQ